MDNIARALLNAAAFLEFSLDDIVDPDSAVKALEDIAFALQNASAEEIESIRRAAAAEREARAGIPSYEGTLEFVDNSLQSVGLVE